MLVKKKIQKDDNTSISKLIHIKWRYSVKPASEEGTDVCENGCVLGIRISYDFELCYEK